MFEKVQVPILGLIENMSSFDCPHCGATTDIFRRGGGQRMSQQLAVPFLGSIPIDPDIVTSGDEGFPIVTSKPESRAAEAYRSIAKRLAETLDRASATPLRPFIWNWETDAGAPGWMEGAISQQGARTAPVGFRKSDQRTLSILWQDGRKDNIDVRDLRLACLCAVCVHEMTGKKVLDPGTVRSDVSPRSINSVGNYAINVTFNDGHSSGIYSFEHLRGLGEASRGKASFDV
jgi:ATP-binding protein involved in chromosome partitioning